MVCVVIQIIFGLGAIFSAPMHYFLFFYILLFAATTMIFEAKPEWVQKVGFLSGYEDMLIARASFLTFMGGRGVFYIFQGTLWNAFGTKFKDGTFSALSQTITMCLLMFVGFLHILAHYGVLPKESAEKWLGEAQGKLQAYRPAPTST